MNYNAIAAMLATLFIGFVIGHLITILIWVIQ